MVKSFPFVPLLALLAIQLGSHSANAQALEDVYPPINIINYGAKCDGQTDDTAALQKAANAVPNTGATLVFPDKTCVISETIFLKSHTHVDGGGNYNGTYGGNHYIPAATLVAKPPYHMSYQYSGAMLENQNWNLSKACYSPTVIEGVYDKNGMCSSRTPLTMVGACTTATSNQGIYNTYGLCVIPDTDISIKGMRFEYGDGMESIPGSAVVRFRFVTNVSVAHNVFRVNGAQDAVAGLGVVNMLVKANYADQFTNCAWDFWNGPANVSILGNFAVTEKTNQLVNYNPEYYLVATGLTMKDNYFSVTGGGIATIDLAPITGTPSVNNVNVRNNVIYNGFFNLRGNVSNANVTDNSINNHTSSPYWIFASYPYKGGIGSNINFSNNELVNPSTQPPSTAVIQMDANNSKVIGNSIIGGNYKVPPILASVTTVTVRDNIVKPR